MTIDQILNIAMVDLVLRYIQEEYCKDEERIYISLILSDKITIETAVQPRKMNDVYMFSNSELLQQVMDVVEDIKIIHVIIPALKVALDIHMRLAAYPYIRVLDENKHLSTEFQVDWNLNVIYTEYRDEHVHFSSDWLR